MEQAAREVLSRLTLSGSFIARGQCRGRDVEARGHSHVVPLLLDERMGAVQKSSLEWPHSQDTEASTAGQIIPSRLS